MPPARLTLSLLACATLSMGQVNGQGVGGRLGNTYPLSVQTVEHCPIEVRVGLIETLARRPSFSSKLNPRFTKYGIKEIEFKLSFENIGEKPIDKVRVTWIGYDSEGAVVHVRPLIASSRSPVKPGSQYWEKWFVAPPTLEPAKYVLTVDGVMYSDGTAWLATDEADGNPPVSPAETEGQVTLPTQVRAPNVAPFGDSPRACDCDVVTSEEADAVRASALSGDVAARERLARMFKTGCFEIQDFVQAHAWFNIAAASGSDSARRCREEVEKDLGADQLHEAQSLARQLRSTLAKPLGR